MTVQAASSSVERELEYRKKVSAITNQINSAESIPHILMTLKDKILELLDAERLTIQRLRLGFVAITARLGYQDTPDVPALLRQAGRDPATGQIAADVEAQTEQTLKNIAAILKAAGSDLSMVVRCGVFLVDIADFQKMNGVYGRMFGTHRPARTTVQVAALPEPRLLVEIDAVAVIP